MSIFATEFSVKASISDKTFMAEAIAWIRGIKNSFVLNDLGAKELEDDDARIESASGEVVIPPFSMGRFSRIQAAFLSF